MRRHRAASGRLLQRRDSGPEVSARRVADGRRSRRPCRNSCASIRSRIPANDLLVCDRILQAKQRYAIYLRERLTKLLVWRFLQPLLKRTQNIVLGAALHRIKKREAELISIRGVEFLQAFVLFRREPVQSRTRLLTYRSRAHSCFGTQVRVRTQQSELFLLRRVLDFGFHLGMQGLEIGERALLPRALRNPWRVLEDPAELFPALFTREPVDCLNRQHGLNRQDCPPHCL